jgi:hypothetical protein
MVSSIVQTYTNTSIDETGGQRYHGKQDVMLHVNGSGSLRWMSPIAGWILVDFSHG